jgi:hypothetical protein
VAELDYLDKLNFESFFGMKSGYVLDFTDRSFQEFVGSVTGKDILSSKYKYQSGSKANRLRAFIKEESDYDVGVLLENLVKYSMAKYKVGDSIDNETFELYSSCEKIAKALKDGAVVDHIDSLKPNNDEKDFKLLAKLIRDSIEKNEPESALDRLHTFLFKFIRELCVIHEIVFEKEESLNAIFGKYVKYLIKNSLVDSTMSEKILKYSVNIIEAFNDVRNNKSLAHDNPVLNYNESILIFNNVINSIKFIQSIEDKDKSTIDTNPSDLDELPF